MCAANAIDSDCSCADASPELPALINVSAAANGIANPVSKALPPGTYQVTLAPQHPAAVHGAWSHDSGAANTWGTHHRIRRVDGREYFGGRATAADIPAEALLHTPNRAVLVEVDTPQFVRFFIPDPDPSDNAGGVSLLLEPAASHPGRVVGESAEGPLRLGRTAGGEALLLQWGPSCSAQATDYAVYEGTLGQWTSHLPLTCNTGGTTWAAPIAGAQSKYYLVVPNSPTDEGVYGVDSHGIPRAKSARPCRAWSIAAVCPTEETIFIGTGDVNAHETYHSILRISKNLQSGSGDCTQLFALDAAVGMTNQGDLTDGDGAAHAIFPHGIYYSAETDELFVAATFTYTDAEAVPARPCGPGAPDGSAGCTSAPGIGSIGVIAGAKSLTHDSTAAFGTDFVLTRHVFDESSTSTTLDQPHSIAYDEDYGDIYVANSSAFEVAVFRHNADGNMAPARRLTNAELYLPFSVAYDASSRRLFVGTHSADTGQPPKVAIYENAPELGPAIANGGIVPDPPDMIVHHEDWGDIMVHNVWYDPVGNDLWIGNHSPTVYRHDLDSLNLASCTTSGTTLDCVLPDPFALTVQPPWTDEVTEEVVTGGLWFDVDEDRLYVSVGENPSGLPVPGPTGDHLIMIWDDARSLGVVSGSLNHDRTVCWEHSDLFYGPQPVAVHSSHHPFLSLPCEISPTCGGSCPSGQTCLSSGTGCDCKPQ